MNLFVREDAVVLTEAKSSNGSNVVELWVEYWRESSTE